MNEDLELPEQLRIRREKRDRRDQERGKGRQHKQSPRQQQRFGDADAGGKPDQPE